MEYFSNDYCNICNLIINRIPLNDTPYSDLCGKEELLYVFINRFRSSLFNTKSLKESCNYVEAVIKLVKNDSLTIDDLDEEVIKFFLSAIYPLDERLYLLYAAILPKELSKKEFVNFLLSFSRLIEEWKLFNIYVFDSNLDPTYKPFKSHYPKYDELMNKLSELTNKYGDKIFNNDLTTIIIAYAYLNQDYSILDRYFSNPNRYIERILLNGYISKYSQHKEMFFDYKVKFLFKNLNVIFDDSKILVK